MLVIQKLLFLPQKLEDVGLLVFGGGEGMGRRQDHGFGFGVGFESWELGVVGGWGVGVDH